MEGSKQPLSPEQQRQVYEEAVLSKPKSVIACRANTHLWSKITPFYHYVVSQSGRNWLYAARDFECTRCHTMRVDLHRSYRPAGDLHGWKVEPYPTRKYTYRKDYALPTRPPGMTAKGILTQQEFLEDMAEVLANWDNIEGLELEA